MYTHADGTFYMTFQKKTMITHTCIHTYIHTDGTFYMICQKRIILTHTYIHTYIHTAGIYYTICQKRTMLTHTYILTYIHHTYRWNILHDMSKEDYPLSPDELVRGAFVP